MAISDALVTFASATTVPTPIGTALVGDVFDQVSLGGGGGEGGLRKLGSGEPVYVYVSVYTKITAGANGTVEFRLSSGSNSAITVGVKDHSTTGAITVGAGIDAGTRYALAFPPGTQFGRYVGIRAVVGTAALAAGKINAGVVLAVPEVTSYPAETGE